MKRIALAAVAVLFIWLPISASAAPNYDDAPPANFGSHHNIDWD